MFKFNLDLYYIKGYLATTLFVFTITCCIDAKRSLDKYRTNKNKKWNLDFDGFWGSFYNRSSEFDALWYGMKPVNNFIGSIVFPYHLITFGIPVLLYKVLGKGSSGSDSGSDNDDNKRYCYNCILKNQKDFDCARCGRDHQNSGSGGSGSAIFFDGLNKAHGLNKAATPATLVVEAETDTEAEEHDPVLALREVRADSK